MGSSTGFVMGQAYDIEVQKILVGTSPLLVCAADDRRRYLGIQNASDGIMTISFGKGLASGEGRILPAGNAGAAGSFWEMSSALGNLTRQGIYAVAAGASKELVLLIATDGTAVEPAEGISSSSSSSSSDSSVSASSASTASSNSSSSSSSSTSTSTSSSTANESSNSSSSSSTSTSTSTSSSTSSYSSESSSSDV